TTEVPLSTLGNSPLSTRRSAGSPLPSTQPPSGVIPIGTTSNRSRSRFASTLPAERHEMVCSLLRPPNTTAIRVLPAFMESQRTGSPPHVSARSAVSLRLVGRLAAAPEQLGQHLERAAQFLPRSRGVPHGDPAVSRFTRKIPGEAVKTQSPGTTVGNDLPFGGRGHDRDHEVGARVVTPDRDFTPVQRTNQHAPPPCDLPAQSTQVSTEVTVLC